MVKYFLPTSIHTKIEEVQICINIITKSNVEILKSQTFHRIHQRSGSDKQDIIESNGSHNYI